MLIRERSFVVGDAEGGHLGGATWRYLGGTLAVPLGAVLVEQLLDHGGAGLRVLAAALDLVTPLRGRHTLMCVAMGHGRVTARGRSKDRRKVSEPHISVRPLSQYLSVFSVDGA